MLTPKTKELLNKFKKCIHCLLLIEKFYYTSYLARNKLSNKVFTTKINYYLQQSPRLLIPYYNLWATVYSAFKTRLLHRRQVVSIIIAMNSGFKVLMKVCCRHKPEFTSKAVISLIIYISIWPGDGAFVMSRIYF